MNNISIDASKDVQLKKSGGKFITVPFAKFGDLYEAAKVHEFRSKGHLNHRDSQGNPLSINVIRKQIEQGVIQTPKTTHMNYHLQLHCKNVAVQEDNTMPVHLFRLNKSLAYENQQAYEVVIAMLHRLVKRRDAPFASLKDNVLFAVEIMKCEYLKWAISEPKQGISARLTGEMLEALNLLVTLRIYTEATSDFVCGEEAVFGGLIDLGSKVKKTKEYAGIGVKYFSKGAASSMTRVIGFKKCSRKDG